MVETVIIIIITAADPYQDLMLSMWDLINSSQKSYTIRYVQQLSHFTDEEMEVESD